MEPGRDGGGGRFRAALVALFVAAACNGGDAGRGDRDADRTAGGNTGGDSGADGGACSSDDPCDAPLICRAGLCVAENDSGVPSAGAGGAPSGGDPGDGDKDGAVGGTAGGDGGAEGGACSSDNPCDAGLICRAGLCVAESDSGGPSAGAGGAPSGGDPGSGGSSGSAGDTGEDPEFVYGVDKAATLARAGLSDPGALVPHEGNLVADIPGHTYRDLDVSGWVDIQADGVTLENVRIRVGPALRENWDPPTQAGIWNYGRPSTFRNVEIAPTHPSVDTYGILGSNYEAYDVSVRDCVDALQVNTNTGPIRVYGGLLDRILWYADDPRQDDGSHSDAIQIIGGSGHRIQGTVIRVGAGPAARTQDGVHAGSFGVIISPGNPGIGPVTDVTVEQVWFEGDGYSHFKLGQGGHGPVTPLRILDCRFEQYTDNPVIHGTAASIDAAEIAGNTGPEGIPLPTDQIWAEGN